MKQRKNPVLSIGMIIKNEMRCLERCLQSLQSLREAVPCELIIADTGSTDGSRELAAQYADVLFDFEWVNDFSVARNAVMDRCTGDWYLTIDADEWIDGDFSQLIQFLEPKNNVPYEAAFVIQRNYMSQVQRDNFGDFNALRLVRLNGKYKMRYFGRIHEEFSRVVDGEKGGIESVVVLHGVILHHDGYMSNTEARQLKSQRNLALLEKELENKPNDVRRLLECTQAAYTKEDKLKYAARMIEAAETVEPEKKNILPAVYQTAILCAYAEGCYDRVSEWLEIGMQKASHSLYLQLDGNGYRAMSAHDEEDYQAAFDYGMKWAAALDVFDKKEWQKENWTVYSQVYLANPSQRFKLFLIVLDAASHLEEWNTANQLLEHLVNLPVDIRLIQTYVGFLVAHADKLFLCSKALDKAWLACCIEDEKQDGKTNYRYQMVAVLFLYFRTNSDTSTPAIRAIAGMEEGDLKYSACILRSDDAQEIAHLWDCIENFDWVLPGAVLHTMSLQLPLPKRLYCRNVEQQSGIIAEIAYFPTFVSVVAKWLKNTPPAESLQEVNMSINLIVGALQLKQAFEEPGLAKTLCQYLDEMSSEYLNMVYNAQVLTEENIRLLPEMKRFLWYYERANAARKKDDAISYIRLLREGLQNVSQMQLLVNFLLQDFEQMEKRKAASPEMLKLADQVCAILAKFAPDDPAVAALKQSEVYQKVAYLIESREAPVWGDMPQ